MTFGSMKEGMTGGTAHGSVTVVVLGRLSTGRRRRRRCCGEVRSPTRMMAAAAPQRMAAQIALTPGPGGPRHNVNARRQFGQNIVLFLLGGRRHDIFTGHLRHELPATAAVVALEGGHGDWVGRVLA